MLPTPCPATGGGLRRWTLWTPAGPVDVEVAAPEDATVGDVQAVLVADGHGGDIWAGSDRLPADLPLRDARLQHGARLGLGRSGPRSADGGGALELHVSGGPDAGRTLALAQGVLVVGRGRGGVADQPRLSLADPDVSRRHLEVAVTGTGVTVRDLGSSNGSSLEGTAGAGGGGRAVGADPVSWPLGAVLRAGSSSLRLAAPAGSPVAVTPGSCGRSVVRSVGRPAPPVLPEVVVSVPEEPAEPPRRALAWLAIALPAVAGGLMAWLLSAPQFLFFALLSPVVALGSWLSDRWSGRRGHRRRTAEHAAGLVRVEAEVVAAVAREVAAREGAAPDPATVAAAVRRRAGPLWERRAGDPDLLVLRLGVGPGATGVLRRPPTGPGVPEPVARVPVVLDLRVGGLGVRGPRETVLGLVRSLVCQAVALHPPDTLRITLVTATATVDDWRWARWLPHLTPHGAPAAAPPGASVHLLVLDAPLDDPTLELARTARAAGAAVLVASAGGTPLDGQGLPVVEVVGETGTGAVLRRPARPDQALVPDLVGREVAEDIAQGMAPLDVPAESGGIPDSVGWTEVVAGRPAQWSRSRSRLVAVLGVGSAGVVELDLCAAGPHALVAGTTGAGKSELLRTLVLGLAAAHPPDLCSFLLVDYKGGAAFAEAADLPHTVGVLTDLDGASTARALRSLGAELTRRERLLAEHGVRDLTVLPDGVLLPRLVIVVDEFATLGDELPGFVPGLVGIAQRGRSLGVHLVLATQRPSGSVSPEIRANCTVRLCLRTTDETGSRDVLGMPDAAWLPVDRPGRALLRIGADPPVAVQVARVGTVAVGRQPVTVRPWVWPHSPAATPGTGGDPTDLAREVTELRARAATAGLPAPPRPWLPVLPDRIEPGALGVHPPGVLAWGLLDRPERQEQLPLLLDLSAGGGWLVVGGPRSGRTTALRAVLAGAVDRLTPEEVHVHVVDHAGGTLSAAARGLPHTGTAVGRDDPYRLQRLLARLQQEVDGRRAATAPAPHLVLLVDGVDSVSTALEELEPGTGIGALLRLVREGAAAGLTCVLSADRVLPGSRLAAAAAHRVVLPFADRADYAVAGVPARSVPGHRPPGRGLVDEDAVEVQLALPGDLPPPIGAWTPVPGRIQVVELPADPEPTPSPAPRPGTVVVGPGGDEGHPVVVDLLRSGGLLVTGPPGSGRSTTLQALGGRLAAAGAPVLHTGLRPVRAGAGILVIGPADVTALRAWGAELAGRPGVVIADDLGVLPDPLVDAIGELTAPGGPAVLVAAATPADVAGAYRGPAVALRRNRAALLLQPARGDAELLSLRLPRAPLPARPGSGWLVLGGTATRVQVAR